MWRHLCHTAFGGTRCSFDSAFECVRSFVVLITPFRQGSGASMVHNALTKSCFGSPREHTRHNRLIEQYGVIVMACNARTYPWLTADPAHTLTRPRTQAYWGRECKVPSNYCSGCSRAQPRLRLQESKQAKGREPRFSLSMTWKGYCVMIDCVGF